MIAALKCNACGASIPYTGMRVIQCPYCDTANVLRTPIQNNVKPSNMRKPHVVVYEIVGEKAYVSVDGQDKTVYAKELADGLIENTIEFDILSKVRVAKAFDINLEDFDELWGYSYGLY